MRTPIRGWSRARAFQVALLLQVAYLVLVALLPLGYFLRQRLFLYGGLVGGLAGGLLLGPLPAGHDRTLRFGSVLSHTVGAAAVGTLGFHVVRFGYVLVAHWSGYPIVQVRATGVYLVTLSRTALVFYVAFSVGKYALAVVLTATAAGVIGYTLGDLIDRRRNARSADRTEGR